MCALCRGELLPSSTDVEQGPKVDFAPSFFSFYDFALLFSTQSNKLNPGSHSKRVENFPFSQSPCACVLRDDVPGNHFFSEHSWKCTYFLVVLLLQPTKIIFLFLARWWGPSQCQAQISSTVGGMMKLAASMSCCCCCCWSPHTETEKNRSKTEKPVPRWRRRLLGAEKKHKRVWHPSKLTVRRVEHGWDDGKDLGQNGQAESRNWVLKLNFYVQW